MDSPSSAKRSEKSRIEKFVRRVISPAVVGKTCPICLRNLDVRGAAVLTVCSHAYCLGCIRKWSDLKRKCPLCNSTFDSWFYKIDLSSRKFFKEQVPALSEGKPVIHRPRSTLIDRRRWASLFVQFPISFWVSLSNEIILLTLNQRKKLISEDIVILLCTLFRIIERTREEMNSVNWRTRPLPWRRSFGRPGTVPPHVIEERKLQWRARYLWTNMYLVNQSLFVYMLSPIRITPIIMLVILWGWKRRRKRKLLMGILGFLQCL